MPVFTSTKMGLDPNLPLTSRCSEDIRVNTNSTYTDYNK